MIAGRGSFSTWGLVFAAAGCLSLGCGTARAQDTKPTEYQVKAAYLANFGKFVEWPSKAVQPGETSFPICVLGDDPFGPDLDAALAGEAVGKLPLRARRLSGIPNVSGCRILFISASKEKQLKTILADLPMPGLLTVSDIPQFARRGGMIEFILENNRVRFEINLDAAARAGISFRSELLRLAATVRGNSYSGGGRDSQFN